MSMKVNLSYGATVCDLDVEVGTTVKQLFDTFKSLYRFPDSPAVKVDSADASMNTVLTEGSKLEFHKKTGTKG